MIDRMFNHYQVFDRKLGKLRDATYSDFSILIDRSTSFAIFKKVFLYKQIPLSIYKDEYLNNSALFLVIRNIFKSFCLFIFTSIPFFSHKFGWKTINTSSNRQIIIYILI